MDCGLRLGSWDLSVQSFGGFRVARRKAGNLHVYAFTDCFSDNGRVDPFDNPCRTSIYVPMMFRYPLRHGRLCASRFGLRVYGFRLGPNAQRFRSKRVAPLLFCRMGCGYFLMSMSLESLLFFLMRLLLPLALLFMDEPSVAQGVL